MIKSVFGPVVLTTLFLLGGVFPQEARAGTCATQSITVGGVARQYQIHVPTGIAGKPAVVIIIEAACSYGTVDTMTGTDFNTVADQNKFLAVYGVKDPGFPGWNDDGRNTSDTQYFSAIIDRLISTNNVDPNRIYVAGTSGGGFMVYNLICDIADKLTAAVSISGGFHSFNYAGCRPSRAVPLLEIHGTKDLNVPYAACPAGDFCLGNTEKFTGTLSAVKYMAGFLQCPDPPVTTTTSYGLESELRSNCGDGGSNAVLELRTKDGGYHSWGGVFSTSNGNKCCQAEVNNEVWDFVSTHSAGPSISWDAGVVDPDPDAGEGMPDSGAHPDSGLPSSFSDGGSSTPQSSSKASGCSAAGVFWPSLGLALLGLTWARRKTAK